jgi:DNA-binding transcriptional MerR regulator
MQDYLTVEEAAAAADVGISTLNRYTAKKLVTPRYGRPVGSVGRGKRCRLFTAEDVEDIKACSQWLSREPIRALTRRWAKAQPVW